MPNNRKYAEGTTVSVLKSRVDIEKVLRDYGVSKIAVMDDDGKVTVMFEYESCAYRFQMPEPSKDQYSYRGTWEQEERRLYRCFFISIKSKVVAVENGIATFEQEFLPHAIMGDGQTVGEVMVPMLKKGNPAIDITRLALPEVS